MAPANLASPMTFAEGMWNFYEKLAWTVWFAFVAAETRGLYSNRSLGLVMITEVHIKWEKGASWKEKVF